MLRPKEIEGGKTEKQKTEKVKNAPGCAKKEVLRPTEIEGGGPQAPPHLHLRSAPNQPERKNENKRKLNILKK